MCSTPKSLQQSIRVQAKELCGYPLPKSAYFLFVAAVITLSLGSYSAILLLPLSPGAALIAMTLGYTSSSVLAISFGHQALHGALFSSARFSKQLGLLSFIPLGLDGELWRIRHLRDHHPKPNTKGHDEDLDNALIFRLAPYTERRRYHRFQHLYAPLVYSFGVLVTVLVEDVRSLVKEVCRNNGRTRTALAAGFIIRKAVFLAIWLGLPLLVNDNLSLLELSVCFALATIPSAWLFLPIAAAHLNEWTTFYERSDLAFADLQAETTVDFANDSVFVTMLYGGLNCHLAHHLWPKVSSCHYQAMYELLEEIDVAGVLAPTNVSFLDLFRSHFRLLKTLGDARAVLCAT